MLVSCDNSQYYVVLRAAVNRFSALNGSVQYQLLDGTVKALCARSAFTFSVFRKFPSDCVFQSLLPGNKGPEPPTDYLPNIRTTSLTTPASVFIYICVTSMWLMQHCGNKAEVKRLLPCLSSLGLLFPNVVQYGHQVTQNIKRKCTLVIYVRKVQSSLLLVSVWCFKCLSEVDKKVTAVGDHVLMAHQRAGGREVPIGKLFWNLKCLPLPSVPASLTLMSAFFHLFKLKAISVGSNHFTMGSFICPKADFPRQYGVFNTFRVPASVGIVFL